jgi:adenine-specific DNA-methyltransferase
MARTTPKKAINGKNGGNGKRITRYTFDDVKEPRTPETGHTALMPADEQVVELAMDNGWSKAIQVGRLPERDRPIAVDMDPAADPILFWAGKRNRKSIPLLPLQRNEIVAESRLAQIVQRCREAAERNSSQMTFTHMFSDLEKTARESQKSQRVDFYTHDENWKNKLICGDSLPVMESLIQYEGLRGKVQMVYVDPPYGIKYDSNFQQRVDVAKNDPTEQADDLLTIKAFRDTWSLGVHSYLSYLSERLYLCRELLDDSGSVFVQIGDANCHLVRLLLDEVFGKQNCLAQIAFVKTSSQSSDYLSSTTDFLLWYGKERTRVKYNQLYRDKEFGAEGAGQYTWVELKSGERRRMTEEEFSGAKPLVTGARIFRHDNLCSTRQGREHEIWPVELDGKKYWPTGSSTWKTNQQGMEKLKSARRLFAIGNTLGYVRYLDDFPAFPITASWTDTAISGFGGDKFYVVQTSPKVVVRCIAMTTDPGDLVLDITAGGGTTPYCAELLGRRWVGCDSSRVAVNVTRQRLLASAFPHFALKGSKVSDGFRYRTLTRVTLGTIASEKEPERIELFDQPEINKSVLRVCGPFEVMSIGRYSPEDWQGYVVQPGEGENSAPRLENYIQVVCRLYRQNAAVQGATGFVHAIAESAKETIAISVGPLSGRVTAKQVNDAVQDAMSSGILETHILGWAFEANVGEVKTQLERRGKVKLQLVMIRPDTLAEGLKVAHSDVLFSPFALPDIDIKTSKKDGERVVQVELKGVAMFDRKNRSTAYKSADTGYVSAWYLDEDYDGDCFVDCQMFFNFKKEPSLRALGLEARHSDFALQPISEPFPIRGYKRIAVKVVDVFGNESTVVRDLA